MAWYLVNSDDLRRLGGHPADPGFGVQGPRPPVDPGYGVPAPPLGIGYPLPTPPVHPWLPGYGGGPGIDNSLPGGGWAGRPDNSLPQPPVHPWMPGWLAGLVGGPSIDNELPGGRPPHVWRPGHIPGLEPPPTKPIDPEAPQTGYVLVWLPGQGYKVIAIPVEPPTAEPK